MMEFEHVHCLIMVLSDLLIIGLLVHEALAERRERCRKGTSRR